MKIEVKPDGSAVIETDGAQALAGTFPVHCEQTEDGWSTADHTSLEIEEAINASLLPVLFVTTPMGVVPCHVAAVCYYSESNKWMEFEGHASWCGGIYLSVDQDGRVSTPK